MTDGLDIMPDRFNIPKGCIGCSYKITFLESAQQQPILVLPFDWGYQVDPTAAEPVPVD